MEVDSSTTIRRGGNVWLAVSGERPVFQYAGIAHRYRLDEREVVAMVSVDTMTHPDFRRRGRQEF